MSEPDDFLAALRAARDEALAAPPPVPATGPTESADDPAPPPPPPAVTRAEDAAPPVAAAGPLSAAERQAVATRRAHARLAAMSPEEYAQRIREIQLSRMSPEEAEAARQADEYAIAHREWEAIGADLRDRYPVVGEVWASGQAGIWELCESAGLLSTEAVPRTNADGSTTKVLRERCPTLVGIDETRDGIELAFEPLPGQSLAKWRTAVGAMRAALGLPTLTVDQVGPHMVVRTLDVVRQLPAALPRPEVLAFDWVAARSVLGETADGALACIDWANNAGMVCGGVPGSGKTASLLPVFAGMAGHAEVHLFDGKASYDWEPLRPICRTFDASGDLTAPLPLLNRLAELRELRARMLYEQTGIANFWSVPATHREALGLYPVIVVLDEAQTWLDPTGLDPEEREVVTQIRRTVRTAVQKGRSSGLLLVVTSQKPTADAIPTNIRDNCDLRIAFRVKTRPAAEAVLGDMPERSPRPTEIPRSAPGRCVLDTAAGHQQVQAYYVEPTVITVALAGHQPVPDQWAIANARAE
ncbi:hypothetical protein KV112_20605 [Mycolicibacter sp. MYC123]|uniref:FtsK domain-containing protein n=1 Tax=[Mycobacterium] zoologicum TaxID=2872311 RepID=A0ABU5YPW5_9MYCO|nr:hypothetical protein [Mycolicibacter sp. MYC123]MEB3052116.1 hypothetical protein [Mycolicibacter sp. MYC123]